MRAGAHTLPVLEGVFAAIDMARSPLLHLLGVVAGVVYLLVAELAFHHGLLLGMNYEANVQAESRFRG
jgi:hypothetical protein